jgi:glycyl-radical enzyme activating protein
MTGTIFDIQRFALHDGPGIRTTVFLKGCPLNCLWCCNPESQSPAPQLGYDESKCIQCMECVSVCPVGALSELDSRVSVDFSLCNACGKCAEVCPQTAFKVYGYKAQSQDIIDYVARDMEYFNTSGGGITISGGDPLFQPNFTIDLLGKAKALNINTCIETSAFAGKDIFERLLSLVDYFYIDYKMTGDHRHKEHTGISSFRVFENIELLNRFKANVVLRCIIIPGINDYNEHFKAIALLSQKYESISQVHILPFHRYGEQKYKQIGLHLPDLVAEPISDETVSLWMDRIRQFGGRGVMKG